MKVVGTCRANCQVEIRLWCQAKAWCLAVTIALLLSASAWSQNANDNASAAVAGTPYASIVARNMFGLLPIPKVDPRDNQPPPDPPPKITPNGIMNVFGKYQALFKVANKPKPGQPAKEDSYVLAEGEMQDDITVVKINHEDGIITFNNHGTTQEIPLVASKDTGGPPPGSVPRFPRPGFPQPGMILPPRPGMGAFQRTIPTGGPAFGNNVSNPNGAVREGADSLTPEQNLLLREAQRMKDLQESNQR